MWANPALAPFNVIPRIKKIVSTKYGNMDVKYTTFKSSRNISRWHSISDSRIYTEEKADGKMEQEVIRRESKRPPARKRKTNWNTRRFPTFPDDCIPFITIKKTTIQLNSRQRTIHHLRLCPSSIDGAASNVVLYQKYAVSELFTHSSTGLLSTSGHFAHGNGSCVESFVRQ